MTLKGNNDFVEVDTAVPQNTCTIEHNVHDNESMINSNITLSKEKRVNAAKDSSYAVLSMESEEDYFEDEMAIDEDGKERSPLVQFWREQCGLFLPMSGWFLFSALLSSYNKVRFFTIIILLWCNIRIVSAYVLTYVTSFFSCFHIFVTLFFFECNPALI